MVPSTNTTEIREGTDRGPSTDRAGAFVTSTGGSPPPPHGDRVSPSDTVPPSGLFVPASSCFSWSSYGHSGREVPSALVSSTTPPKFWRGSTEPPPPLIIWQCRKHHQSLSVGEQRCPSPGILGSNSTTDPGGEPLPPDQSPFSVLRRSWVTRGGIINVVWNCCPNVLHHVASPGWS